MKLLELIKKSFPVADPDRKNPEPVIASRVIANPPIFPVVAFMVPETINVVPFHESLSFKENCPVLSN